MNQPKIKLTETHLPTGGSRFWNRKFYTMPVTEIEDLLQEELQQYAAAGYNSFLFHRVTGTVFIRKIEIKSIDDILATDQYGLLEK